MLDHSLTYKDKKIKNLPHRLRLKAILLILDQLNFNRKEYCDVGCSNGWITSIIKQRYGINHVVGFDHELEYLEAASNTYPDIDFLEIDLNVINEHNNKFDIVTCFETLEHVGNIENAITNLLNLANNGSIILISVPIEVGFIGIVKFLVKTLIYGYKLDELNKKKDKYFYWKYLFSLIMNRDIGRYRSNALGYGTHFGFDYKIIKKILSANKNEYSFKVKGSTAFFIIQC